MRNAACFRALLSASASLFLAAGCSDASGPDEADLTAYRLEALAESLGTAGSGMATLPLLMASQSVRAGAALRTFDVTVDGVTSTWTGITSRMSFSETACAQLREAMPGFPGAPDFCAPSQFTVVWDGELPEASRLITFGGDTGSVHLGFGEFGADSLLTIAFDHSFASLHDIAGDRFSMSDSGVAANRLLSTGSVCPRQPVGSARAGEVSCRLATYRIELAARFREFDFDRIPIFIEPPLEDGAPAPIEHRVSIAAQSVAGMHLEILRYPGGAFGGPRGVLDAGAASPREPAALLTARMLFAR